MTAKNRRFSWKWILVLLLLGFLGWGVRAYWLDDSTGGGLPVQVARVDRGDLQQTISAAGQLRPVLNVQVGSQISGIVQEMLVDFNSPVRQGQVLTRLDPATFQANVRQAEGELAGVRAALELARVKARRGQQLFEQGLISQADLDEAIANLRQAEATVQIRTNSLERAQLELARCTIYSPTDGIVISRNVDVGQTVAASLSAPVLFEIANDLTRMQIVANISEADIGRIRNRQQVRFRVDAYPGESFQGVVTQIRNAPRMMSNVVTYDTIIEVDNADLRLKPGMTAEVWIIVAEVSQVLRVPNAALRTRLPEALRPPDPPEAAGAARHVYRMRQDGGESRLEAVTVSLGISDGVYTEVREGLAEGDTLVTGVALQTSRGDRNVSVLLGGQRAQF